MSPVIITQYWLTLVSFMRKIVSADHQEKLSSHSCLTPSLNNGKKMDILLKVLGLNHFRHKFSVGPMMMGQEDSGC